MEKIGIIGGLGYIGSHLANHLSRKFKVVILDVGKPIKYINNCEYVRCDIRNEIEVKKVEGLAIIINTAIVQIPKINEEKRLGYNVNVMGTQNLCKAIDASESTKGLLLAGTWHTIGERDIVGIVDESFGYRPDKVEDRARMYVLSKILQEITVRFYDEFSEKVFGVIRMGTVLGEGMPEKTAASIFIERGLKGLPITPYNHTMYRPMLYVDIRDICKAFEAFALMILEDKVQKTGNSLNHIINVAYPEPITILELAHIVRDSILELTDGRIVPPIKIVDKGLPILFSPEDKKKLNITVEKSKKFLRLGTLVNPRESLRYLVRKMAMESMS